MLSSKPGWQFDGAGQRARIGLLTPHLDPVPESEFNALAPPGVSVHAARVPLGMIGPEGEIIPRVDAEIATAFAQPPALDNAARLVSAVAPNAIAYAFTSSSYIAGAQSDKQLRQRLEGQIADIPVIVQAEALTKALRALESKRIALMHPPWFSAQLDTLGAQYFAHEGFDVVYHAPASLRSDYGDIAPELIYDWAEAKMPDNADALVIGGGGFRAIGVIDALESALGRPVISANQATFWCALRTAGISDAIAGYGRLFDANLP